ncbi:hypothetical protein V9T40_001663 [Parthenolecanium corni]|uniref:WH1 domain-containing protein n=1 Tax=Parthenolecanium corni TaxID=536013 RepID=A0AAN9Y6T1_9HEMI
MTSGKEAVGEQPIFTCKAHVFHIDPKTKRSWLPASTASINVSFFYDSTRSLYRIISVEGTKAIINSTVTPNMTFTKTSQKFGQWSDLRANTIYGLGFNSEFELNKFIERFQEVKEATRLAACTSTNGSAQSGAGSAAANSNASPVTSRSVTFSDPGLIDPPNIQATTPGTTTPSATVPADDSLDLNKVPHPRNTSLSTSQAESPKHHTISDHKPSQSSGMAQNSNNLVTTIANNDSQLKYENDRLKLALAHSSANAKKWEIELQTLKNNNMRLTSALQESTANVDEWKRQLQSYKEENQRLKNKYIDLEASKIYSAGGNDGALELRKELSLLRLKVETLEIELKTKDDDIKRLQSQKGPHEDRCKILMQENAELQAGISLAQTQLETALAAQETQRRVIDTLNAQLAARIQELAGIHKEIAMALQT